MHRRAFIAGAAVGALAIPLGASAQQQFIAPLGGAMISGPIGVRVEFTPSARCHAPATMQRRVDAKA